MSAVDVAPPPAPSAPTPPAIDRLVARLGAAELVAGRPGMGWLLVEMAPAVLWTSLSGAVQLEAFYLVSYLTLLGASTADLAWLPCIAYAGILVHPAVVLLRHGARGDADPHRSCWMEALFGRTAWLGTVLWPPLAWWLGLSTAWVLGGVLAAIFVAQVLMFSSMASFMTWTQGLVPAPLRGRFFAWRNVSTFLLVAVVTQVMAMTWPVHGEGAPDAGQLPWFMGLFAITTLLAILSTAWLSWAPGSPPRAPDDRGRGAFSLRGQGALVGLMLWAMTNTAATACIQTYLPGLLHAAAVDTRDYARWQGLAMLPCLLLGIVAGGALLGRWGGRRLLLLAHLATVAGDAVFLTLGAGPQAWLFPLAMGMAGAARGLSMMAPISRLFEVAPRGDTRYFALYLAATGLAGMASAMLLRALVPWLESAHAAGRLAAGPAWTIVLGAVAFRLLATPLAWGWRAGDAGR